MNELTAALKEELNVDTAFTLPIFGGIDIPESIAVSWGIMAFLVIVSILLTRNLKVNHISKRQAILETAVVTMDNFFKDLLGEAGKQYVPYLITVALYIACSNLIGIIGLKPPTKDLNVTAALTGIGAGIGIGIATGKAAEAISRQPEAESKISKNLLLGAALAEGTAIFGFVVALLIILFLG